MATIRLQLVHKIAGASLPEQEGKTCVNYYKNIPQKNVTMSTGGLARRLTDNTVIIGVVKEIICEQQTPRRHTCDSWQFTEPQRQAFPRRRRTWPQWESSSKRWPKQACSSPPRDVNPARKARVSAF